MTAVIESDIKTCRTGRHRNCGLKFPDCACVCHDMNINWATDWVLWEDPYYVIARLQAANFRLRKSVDRWSALYRLSVLGAVLGDLHSEKFRNLLRRLEPAGGIR